MRVDAMDSSKQTMDHDVDPDMTKTQMLEQLDDEGPGDSIKCAGNAG